MEPLVTIGCLSYNTGNYVIKAIESVLNSSYKNIQIIVVDDCSSDQIKVKLLENYLYNFSNIEYIKHKENKGIPFNVNLILNKAKGKYLCFVCDDLILENRIKEDVDIFEKLDEDYILIHSIAQSINHNGELIDEISPDISKPIVYKDLIKINEIIQNPFINAVTVTYRVDLVKKIGGWDESLLFEDNPFWFKICELNKKIKFNPKINTYYRKHLLNTSNNIRHGFWIYQFELYSRYSIYPEAQLKLKKLLTLSCGAVDYKDCLKIYSNSNNYSHISYFTWLFLDKIKYNKLRNFILIFLKKVKNISIFNNYILLKNRM